MLFINTIKSFHIHVPKLKQLNNLNKIIAPIFQTSPALLATVQGFNKPVVLPPESLTQESRENLAYSNLFIIGTKIEDPGQCVKRPGIVNIFNFFFKLTSNALIAICSNWNQYNVILKTDNSRGIKPFQIKLKLGGFLT